MEGQNKGGGKKSGYSTPIGLNEIPLGCYLTKIKKKTTHRLPCNSGLIQDFVTKTRS